MTRFSKAVNEICAYEIKKFMERNRTEALPRWIFTLLYIGGAWASGIYLGKLTVEGVMTGLLIPMISFSLMGLIIAGGALSERAQ
jgi:hypothetical protein